jgi:hypothetical protein
VSFSWVKIVEMAWTTVQESKPDEKSDSDSVKSSGSDSESDSKNSDDSALGKRARVRHDSSDSDISIDAEEQAEKKMNREQTFKRKIVRALGMGDVEPANPENQPENDQNSDISVDDSKSSEIDDENVRKLQAAKEAELLKEAALEYENIDQIIRDKDGKQIQVTDLLASKVKRLEELNAKNVNYSLPQPKTSSQNGKAVTSNTKNDSARLQSSAI